MAKQKFIYGLTAASIAELVAAGIATAELLELGVGFAFVGSQHPIEVGGEDFRIDILFYHLRLRCFVVLDLKMTPFKPEYAGKMNFYLSAVDDQLKHPDDQPTIGIILYKGKNQVVVEYALRDTSKPMGVAEFRLLEQLPEQLKAKCADDRRVGSRTREGRWYGTLSPAG